MYVQAIADSADADNNTFQIEVKSKLESGDVHVEERFKFTGQVYMHPFEMYLALAKMNVLRSCCPSTCSLENICMGYVTCPGVG